MYKIDKLDEHTEDSVRANRATVLLVGIQSRFKDHQIWKLRRLQQQQQLCRALLMNLAIESPKGPDNESPFDKAPTDLQELIVLVGSIRCYHLHDEDSCESDTLRKYTVEQNRRSRLKLERKIARTIAKRKYPGVFNSLKARSYKRELIRDLHKYTEDQWRKRIEQLFEPESEEESQKEAA
jgi:hypothetical protein